MTGDPMPTDLPYAGTSGWSGSDASRERAEREASNGTASARQQMTRSALAVVGSYGMTWKELAESYDWHHGQASGVLSVLHKTGRIARLKDERRDRCSVYVLPEYVMDRPTAPHGGKGTAKVVLTPAQMAEQMAVVGLPLDSRTYDQVRRLLLGLGCSFGSD